MDLSLLNADFIEKIFRYKIDKKDLTDEIEKMLNKEKVKEFTYIEKVDHFLITFNKKEYKIFKNPICFKSFLDKSVILFKSYTEENLSTAINLLKSTYVFFENENVVEIENIKFNSTKEIILVPYLYAIFVKLSWENLNLKELKEFDEVEIDPFILEPCLLIDENKTKEKEEFNLIINQERINFFEAIIEYINLKNTNEPMIIFGNEGIGKSVSLQYLTNLNLDLDCPILYFNFKIMETHDLIEYISLAIMKGFLNRKNIDCNNEVFNESIKKSFGEYIDFLKNFREIVFNKSFWEILFIIFSNNLLKKSVLIFDQFNYESKFYNGYNEFLSLNRMRKIILCHTLNDSHNKETLFSMLKNIASNMNIFKNYFWESKESNLQKDNDKGNKKIDEEEDIDETDYFKKFIIFEQYLNRKAKLDDDDKQNIKTKKEDNQIQKDKDKDNFIDDTKKQDVLLGKKRRIRRMYENSLLNQIKEIIKNNKNEQIQKEKVKKFFLYYNNLINIKDIIQDNDIKECLYYFNYSPKYYSKFLKFYEKQKESNVSNIKDIIQNYYEDQFEKISINIQKFYLNKNQIYKAKKLPLLNPLEKLIKLKKVVENKEEINFFKLNEYSKIFCFKYLYLTEFNNGENKKYCIDLSQKDNKKDFTLNYTSLFVKIANERIINNLISISNIFELNRLSGSAFGTILELKFKEEIVENKYFNIKFICKKVWNFEILDKNLKKNKYDEYLTKKRNSNHPKFHTVEELDDVLDYKFILNDKYYYINPKSQINKNFDSLMLIKTTQEHEYNMILFRHAKYKDRTKIKTKDNYKKYAEDKVKPKFEQLYNIKIAKIYFLFILSNEHKENEETYKILNNYKIGYLFYSIENKEIYKQRSTGKINNIGDLMNPNYLIFPNEDTDKIYFTFNMQMIDIIERIIKNKLENKEKINYEKIRKKIIPYSVGLKINNDLKSKIINSITSKKNSYDSYDFLFYASIPYDQLTLGTTLENDLFFIFKIDNIIYLYHDETIFVIDVLKNSIKEKNKKLFIFDLLKPIYKNGKNAFIKIDNEVELKDIPDLNKGKSNIFIFKIYKMTLKTNFTGK